MREMRLLTARSNLVLGALAGFARGARPRISVLEPHPNRFLPLVANSGSRTASWYSGPHITVERPLIAVVGDASRASDPSLAKRAARELGNELRKRNCRLLVFSSSAQFIEWETVQGYRDTKDRLPPASIEVRYPPDLHSLFPNEKPDDVVFVRRQQGRDWEASIYPSFAEVKGLVLVGGAYTTKIAGLLAMGSKTPVITLAGLGTLAAPGRKCVGLSQG